MLADSTAEHWRAQPSELRRRHAELESVESPLVPLELLASTFACPERVLAARCPVSVVGGSEDALMTPQVVESTAAAYGVSATIVQGVGHALMQDVHADRAISAILDACSDAACAEHAMRSPP
jgi:pimeloyl-ACP methyl ester carboxylesterase